MRYFIQLSYDGTNYHGWQIQPNATSIQECLNNALSTLLRTPIQTIGAGRTDAGVHAAMMVAHFDTSVSFDPVHLTEKLCRLLPTDIAVNRVYPVSRQAHARFDATARTYHYHIYTYKNPFRRYYATRLHFFPDYIRMNEAASKLLDFTDFTSFSKLHTDTKTNICHITNARWVQIDNDLWRFEITADRFLRNMVRAIVGTLLEVGRGRISISDFCRIIESKDRCAAGDSVPGNALSLVDITYPEHILQTEHI